MFIRGLVEDVELKTAKSGVVYRSLIILQDNGQKQLVGCENPELGVKGEMFESEVITYPYNIVDHKRVKADFLSVFIPFKK